MTRLFSVKLLFHSFVADRVSLEEVAIWIVEANNEEEAYLKGQVIGKEEEHEYANEYGQVVQWRFVRVVDHFQLTNPLTPPCEVFSTMREVNESDVDG